MKKIIIINTGCANFFSLKNAIQRLKYKVKISSNIQDILMAQKIFLPGVGTMRAAMNYLNLFNLIPIIKNLKVPVLGICLGMQIFFSNSQENGCYSALNIIPESIIKLKSQKLFLPHIGWNIVQFKKNNLLFKNIPFNSRFYFLHSYCSLINQYTLAKTKYGSFFSSAVQKKNFFGVQFHPEKSGKVGEQLLKNFLEI
ncbi:imidazole glycerol phosphate synthase subunit HisH [Buchnera aphidicola]|uniref:Imidazole glycerol phosphate synthase subunit HisH n=1 Tax=Buchnera aphidicola subsp. Tuberolachnus salignus TaxID=98804 RepID=A0A160SXY2_BUCTT|nr:imidazole glycerol phosphate synthase subunit HisH [Buchnera aphidicola]CUR53054.1 Imidazole glycerol phosphate synthase subunit HisH [Buchnera aphidicola (Tuberolachnus salignus)]